MNLRQLLWFTAAILVAPLHSALAEDSPDQAALQQVEKASATALIAGDVKALTEVFAPDWKLVSADGMVLGREELFKEIAAGTLKFSSYEVSSLDVRVYHDAAVVIGSGKAQGEFKGDAFTASERFTDVFIRQDGKWRCVSTHSSNLEE